MCVAESKVLAVASAGYCEGGSPHEYIRGSKFRRIFEV